VTISKSTAELDLVRLYDDGAGCLSTTYAKERAFRQGFVEEARRIVREWVDPDDETQDPFGELQSAHRLRLRIQEKYAVYGPGCAGRRTYHLGFRPGHEIAAARARGRHHALVYVVQSWEEVDELELFDQIILPAWLAAVERWAEGPIRLRPALPPPRPLEIDGIDAISSAVGVKPALQGTSKPKSANPNPPDAVCQSVELDGLRIEAICLADVEPQPVRWLWPGRFPLGKLSLIAGEPGLGKSFLTLDMAARVSRGDGWPCNESARSEPGGVVLLSAEDDISDTIVPRLIAAHADRSRIRVMRALYRSEPSRGTGAEKPLPFNLLEHVPLLEKLIRRVAPCKLVIVDPVSAFLGTTDSHNNSEVRSALAPLSSMAAHNGVAVVAVTHLNKGQGSALNRVIGSIAFTAAARAAYVVTRDEDDPARRLMLPAKNNLSRDQDGFAYRLAGDPVAHVEWEAVPVAMSADEAVGQQRRTRGPEPDARRDAEAWLLDFLTLRPKPASKVFDAAKAHGHTQATTRQAEAALDIKSSKENFDGPWVWILPGGGPVMVGGDASDE